MSRDRARRVGLSRNTRDVAVISIAFFVQHSAFYAVQNLQSSINQEAGLGLVCLLISYSSFILSGFFSPLFVAKFKTITLLTVGMTSHCVYVFANFYPSWWTLVPASVYIGFFAGPFWTTQGIYIKDLAENEALSTNSQFDAVLNRYNGIFFMTFSMSEIMGNLLSSLVLRQPYHGLQTKNNQTLFNNISNVQHVSSNVNMISLEPESSFHVLNATHYDTCGSLDCLSPYSNTTHNSIKAPEYLIIYILMSVFAFLSVLGIVIFLICAGKSSNDRITHSRLQRIECIHSMTSCFLLNITDINMLCLIPLISSQSLINGILRADFTKSYVSCALGVGMVGFVMASYGASTAANAFAFSRLAKYAGRIFLLMVACLVNITVLVAILLWEADADRTWPFFLVATVWGIGDGILITQGYALIAFIFPQQLEAAFSIYWMWKAVGYTASFGLSYVLCVSHKIFLALTLQIVATFMYAFVELTFTRRQPEVNGPEIEVLSPKTHAV